MKKIFCDVCKKDITDIPEEQIIQLKGFSHKSFSLMNYEEFEFCSKNCFLKFIENKE